jgi:hypothetical protein
MNDVAKKKKSEISTNVIDFSNHAGVGFENVGSQEMAIPFLKIASSQTPEVKKTNSKFVEGLDQGDIFNSVTKDFYKSILVVPCHFRVRGVEWSPLGEGTGAPVKIYKPEDIPTLTRGADGEDHYMINFLLKMGHYSLYLYLLMYTKWKVFKKQIRKMIGGVGK